MPTLEPKRAVQLLRNRLREGEELHESAAEASHLEAWQTATKETLTRAFGSQSGYVIEFGGSLVGSFTIGEAEPSLQRKRLASVGDLIVHLRSALRSLEEELELGEPSAKDDEGGGELSSEVFVVHGHEEAVLAQTARLLGNVGLTPIILREQPNQGQTIIEKFESHSGRVGFAVVLLTGDDRGGTADTPYEDQKKRARQNVILELGYFMGALGRKHVCALYEDGVEIPSDYNGVVFVPIDSSGKWRYDLARELREAGLSVDMNQI